MTNTRFLGSRLTRPAESLPVAALLALAMTGFVAILTETLPAGLLPQIGEGLRVSPALAGQWVTLYAAGSLVASLPLTVATQGWCRRPVLLSAISGFLVFNTITAFSSTYGLTLAARFLAGVAAGLAWGSSRATRGDILYTYVAAFVAPAGLDRSVSLVLLDFGLSAVAGIWVTGVLIDRHLRALVLGSLAGFALAVLCLAAGRQIPGVIYAAVACWGVTFGGAGTQLGTAMADAAGEGVDLGQALITTVWNSAIAGGGLVGGVLLTRFGPAAFPAALLGLLFPALAVVCRSRMHGFPPGPRAATPIPHPF